MIQITLYIFLYQLTITITMMTFFHPSNITDNPHLHDTYNTTAICPHEQLTFNNSSINPPIDIYSDNNSNPFVDPPDNVKHLHTFLTFTQMLFLDTQ